LTRDGWFRNNSWNAEIEKAFNERLRRSRDKWQYLRIQASYLTETHPAAALRLLDDYFALGEHFDQAQAHVEQARAHLTFGNIDLAVGCYEAALERELKLPNYKTQAHIKLPLLIATRKLTEHYSRAISILDANQARLAFPVERYRAHGARALILHDLGKSSEARESANAAIAAASETRSGFRYHQELGLVTSVDDELGRQLKAIAQRQ
jgi:tetratricopeptide (TPR) repeat protein